MKPNWTIIIVVLIILILGGLAFFTYLEKAPTEAQAPGENSGGSQKPDSLMQQVFQTIQELKTILEKDPQNLQALITLGNIYYDGQKFEQAIQYYRKALEIDSKNSAIWTDLGTMYFQLGEVDTSLACYQKAVEFDAKNKSAWFNLGLVYLQVKKDEKNALGAWKKFIELSPDDLQVQAIRQEIEKLEKKLK